jgi:hypothetical protein
MLLYSLYLITVMWCTSTRVVETKKGFRGHTITEHISGFREQLGYVRLDLRRRMLSYGFIFKLFLTKVPDYLYSRFIFFSNVHSYRTRDFIIFLMHVSGLMTSSFTVTASGHWNVVDPLLRDSSTVHIFIKNVVI